MVAGGEVDANEVSMPYWIAAGDNFCRCSGRKKAVPEPEVSGYVFPRKVFTAGSGLSCRCCGEIVADSRPSREKAEDEGANGKSGNTTVADSCSVMALSTTGLDVSFFIPAAFLQ